MTDEQAWSRVDGSADGDRPPIREDVGPSRLGKYELVYEIGRGGMANVYLARASGVAGFRRWCAIKRIHPHLASDKRFVSMFLDEARIASALSHPNVAHVSDLGREGRTYFIAMEYLHGEHLGAVGAAADRSRGGLGVDVAAWIIAQAARGLHHAHEAKDDAGKPLLLVHRDISPQNIFVTYDGGVKVTDFGIAKAANRTTHTRTGDVKGKCAYMAPEQALGQPVDRRADVFALGVVLWEQSTGHYLFRAESDAVTLLRVTTGEIAKPTAVVPDYPPELERIVMRALARLPSERYRTAEDLARDLERFLADRGFAGGADEIAAIVKGLFADRMAAKDAVLSGAAAAELPAALRSGEDETRSSWRIAQPYAGQAARGARSPTGRRLAIALGAVALALGVAAVLSRSGHDSPGVRTREPAQADRSARALPVTPHSVAAATPVAAAPAPPAAPPPEPTVPVDREPAAAPPAVRARTDGPVGTARLSLITRPWALVWINGRPAGETPLMEAEIPAGRTKLELQPVGHGAKRVVRVHARAGETISRNVVLE